MNYTILIWFHGRNYPDYRTIYTNSLPDAIGRLCYEVQIDVLKVSKIEIFPRGDK